MAFEKTPEQTILKNFLVLEGLDGAGTTTQLRLLRERLLKQGYSCYGTFEPSDGPVGRLIRKILAKEISVTPTTLAYLFASDRNEHLYNPEEGIIAQIKKGNFVICDRYIFSSLAYQTTGSGYDFVYSLNNSFPLPEICVFIDVPEEVCETRMSNRLGRELFDDRPIQRSILENYEKAFSLLLPRGIKFLRVDGRLPIAEVTEKIWSFLNFPPIQGM